jgi:CDP-4-dehydro-6-deoxyglucose reductase
MPKVRYNGKSFDVNAGETVLDALERQGEAMAHSCRAGVCQSCVLRCVEGVPPPESQKGLKDNQKVQGDFLSCVARPEQDLAIALSGDTLRMGAVIEELGRLSDTVLRVRLATESPLPYRAGQYVTFLRPGLSRSYSIASLPEERTLEFHVRRIEGGQMSGWLHDQAMAGDSLTIQGPLGDCFYTQRDAAQPLLLAGAGTGLAPLYGIVRDALRQGHTGPILLYHGARNEQGLYLVDDLNRLCERHPQVEYHPTLTPLDETILSGKRDWKPWRAYFCGDPTLVMALKKKLFLAGMPMREIFADPFLPAAKPSALP